MIRMKENHKKIKIKGVINPFVITCPVCGYSFRKFDPKLKKSQTICPMCGYKFIKPHVFPQKPDERDKKFF